ncbi:alpha/beta hydrolase [Streptomyces sp. A5-4]|uniref:alpha/beta hydrolase n=1 Tax=Streptomyces sp. A5-4 TaxID=3384771 RepID=UPI003DA7BDD3
MLLAADHTAVYVPGTKTNFPGIGEDDKGGLGDLGRGESLWHESSQMSPGSKVSTITWFDYNAPDTLVPQATRGSYADEGGPTLHQFMQGQEAAHREETGTKAHTTVMGHGYGSTVVGVATQSGSWQDGPMADDIIAVGSPGMQVDRAADMGLKPDHVWAMGGGGDDNIVRHGGKWVGLGDNLTVPTDEKFGENVMKSDSPDHGSFWDPESTSLENQAAVISGRHDRVTLE